MRKEERGAREGFQEGRVQDRRVHADRRRAIEEGMREVAQKEAVDGNNVEGGWGGNNDHRAAAHPREVWQVDEQQLLAHSKKRELMYLQERRRSRSPPTLAQWSSRSEASASNRSFADRHNNRNNPNNRNNNNNSDLRDNSNNNNSYNTHHNSYNASPSGHRQRSRGSHERRVYEPKDERYAKSGRGGSSRRSSRQREREDDDGAKADAKSPGKRKNLLEIVEMLKSNKTPSKRRRYDQPRG